MRLGNVLLGVYSLVVSLICLHLAFHSYSENSSLTAFKLSDQGPTSRSTVIAGGAPDLIKPSDPAKTLAVPPTTAVEATGSGNCSSSSAIQLNENIVIPGLGNTPIRTEEVVAFFQNYISNSVKAQLDEIKQAVLLTPELEQRVTARFAEEALAGMLLEGEAYITQIDALTPLEQILGQEAYTEYEMRHQAETDRWQAREAEAEGKYLTKLLDLTSTQTEILKASLIDPERHIQKESVLLTDLLQLTPEQDQNLLALNRRMEAEDLFAKFESAHPELRGQDGTTDPYAYQAYLNEYQLKAAATFLDRSQLEYYRNYLYDTP